MLELGFDSAAWCDRKPPRAAGADGRRYAARPPSCCHRISSRTDQAGTQLPWKPNGTRCGALTRATGLPEKSLASIIASSLEFIAGSYQTASAQPSSSAAPGARGTNTGSPG